LFAHFTFFPGTFPPSRKKFSNRFALHSENAETFPRLLVTLVIVRLLTPEGCHLAASKSSSLSQRTAFQNGFLPFNFSQNRPLLFSGSISIQQNQFFLGSSCFFPLLKLLRRFKAVGDFLHREPLFAPSAVSRPHECLVLLLLLPHPALQSASRIT